MGVAKNMRHPGEHLWTKLKSIIYWMSLSIFFSRWKELHMCIQWWKKKKLHLLFIWSIWRLKKSPVSRSEGHGYTTLCDKVYDDSNQGCPLEMTNNAEHSQCLHLSLSVYLHPENQDAKLGKPYSEWPVHQISISLLPSNLQKTSDKQLELIFS